MANKSSIKTKILLLIPIIGKLFESKIILEQKVFDLETAVSKQELRLEEMNNILKKCFNTVLNALVNIDRSKLITSEWLTITEHKYGGKSEKIKRNKVSELDPRTKEDLLVGGMVGGDRMSLLDHNYASLYAHYLEPHIKHDKKLVLVEVGILKGTGLAIWSDLFQNGRIIGLDIDLEHFQDNIENLRALGAFKNENVEVHEFDQFKNNEDIIAKILKGDKINIVIDDGIHMDRPIITTLESFIPFLAEDFVYVIEDNKTVFQYIRSKYPSHAVNNHGEITFINR